MYITGEITWTRMRKKDAYDVRHDKSQSTKIFIAVRVKNVTLIMNGLIQLFTSYPHQNPCEQFHLGIISVTQNKLPQAKSFLTHGKKAQCNHSLIYKFYINPKASHEFTTRVVEKRLN